MSDGSDMSERERRIRDRAEQLWNEAGQPMGRDEEFWLAAEADVDAAAPGAERRPLRQ
jgi:hypothetical protein